MPSPEATPERFLAPRRRIGRDAASADQFPQLPPARLDWTPSPVVLTGPNGAGKTNLLEALSFLAPGRGLRGARLDDIDRRAAQRWPRPAALGGRRDARRRRRAPAVGTGREPTSEGGERRVVRIDGQAAASQTALGRSHARWSG